MTGDAFTICPLVSVPVLAALLLSPLYSAVMVLVPVVVKLVMHCALAATITTAVQPTMLAPPFLNWMVPVGLLPVTVAVKITLALTMLGEPLLVTAVEVDVTGVPTTRDNVGDSGG